MLKEISPVVCCLRPSPYKQIRGYWCAFTSSVFYPITSAFPGNAHGTILHSVPKVSLASSICLIEHLATKLEPHRANTKTVARPRRCSQPETHSGSNASIVQKKDRPESRSSIRLNGYFTFRAAVIAASWSAFIAWLRVSNIRCSRFIAICNSTVSVWDAPLSPAWSILPALSNTFFC